MFWSQTDVLAKSKSRFDIKMTKSKNNKINFDLFEMNVCLTRFQTGGLCFHHFVGRFLTNTDFRIIVIWKEMS